MEPDDEENESGLFDFEREQWEAEMCKEYEDWLDFIETRNEETTPAAHPEN